MFGLIQSNSAALPFPCIFQLHSTHTERIYSRSTSCNGRMVVALEFASVMDVSTDRAPRAGNPSSTRLFPVETINERSIIFSSSQTLPGQLYCLSLLIRSASMWLIFLPIFNRSFSTRYAGSKGISSCLSRNAGTVIGNTCQR